MTDTRTGLARVGTGGKSYSAYGLEYTPNVSGTPGTTVARNLFAPVVSNGLTPNRSRGRDKLQSNLRQAERTNIGLITTAEGPLVYRLNPVLLTELLEWVLGANASIAKVTDVTTSAVVTANGQSVFSAPSTFNDPGAPIYFNTGANMEARSILSYATGAVTCEAFKKSANVAALTGAAVVKSNTGGLRFAPSLLPSGFDDDLERMSVERVIGGKWGMLFPGVIAEKLTVDMPNNTFVTATIDQYSTFDWSYLASGGLTAYAPDNTKEKRALNPFSFLNGVIALPVDVSGSGTSALGLAVPLKSAKLEYDNGIAKFNAIGSTSMSAVPGDDGSFRISYDEYDVAWRPNIWLEYLAGDLPALFQFGLHKNYGTASSPNYGSVVFRCPNNVYENQAINDAVSAERAFTNTASGLIDRAVSTNWLEIAVAPPS